jgi:hypothetical protein
MDLDVIPQPFSAKRAGEIVTLQPWPLNVRPDEMGKTSSRIAPRFVQQALTRTAA